MKTYIVLLAVDVFTRDQHAELIAGETFKDLNSVYDLLQKDTEEDIDRDDVWIFTLTDFMIACNNQEVELEIWWVTYVNIEDNMDGKGAGFQGSGNDIKSDGLSGFRG